MFSFKTQILWRSYFKYDCGSSWITCGLLIWTLAIVIGNGHDESYIPNVHPHLCAGVVLVVCKITKQWAYYWGEILAGPLTVGTATDSTCWNNICITPIKNFCDNNNMDVVIHGNHPAKLLKADQVTANVLWQEMNAWCTLLLQVFLPLGQSVITDWPCGKKTCVTETNHHHLHIASCWNTVES